jgi:hypothetical protein
LATGNAILTGDPEEHDVDVLSGHVFCASFPHLLDLLAYQGLSSPQHGHCHHTRISWIASLPRSKDEKRYMG